MVSIAKTALLFLPHLDVSGGLGVHCRMLLTALDEVPSHFHFAVVSPAQPEVLFPTTGLEEFNREAVDATRFRFTTLGIPDGFSLALPLDAILKIVVDELKPDLLYCSYYTGMLSPPCPQIVAFHDAGFLENPAGFGATAAIRRQTLATIRDSISLIQCISYDARDRICRRLPWDAAKTAVVWHALPDSTALLAAASTLPAQTVTLDTMTLGALKPYFFLPVGAATGFNRVRKNVPNAVTAFRRLSAESAHLIIAGTAKLTQQVLDELLPPTESGQLRNDCWVSADGRIIIVPTLERLQFLTAMKHATAVLYPSRYEGFGLPTLEAMALGVPLIASDATSIPEIVADAGVLVPPDDVAGFATAMLKMSGDEALRNDVIRRGQTRVRDFTMARLGTVMVRMFNTVID